LFGAQVLKSVGQERVLNDSNVSVAAAEPVDGDDIEAARLVESIAPREIVERHGGDAALFPRRHAFGRAAVSSRPSRFHFDEHDGVAVLRDDVNFSKPRAIPACKNCIASPLQLAHGKVFPLYSDLLTKS
jgi:hypothetical protein